MTDLAQKMEAARGALKVDWNPDRARAAERGMVRLRRRRAAVRTVGASLAVLALVAGTAVVARMVRPPEPMAIAEGRVLRFEDGSLATLEGDATVTRTSNEPGRTVVEIVKGGARFKVARNPTRVFRVESGQVAVEVLGTEFTVDNLEGRSRVAVHSGRVRVIAPSGTLELGAGESGEFPDAAAELATAAPDPEPDPTPAPTPSPRPRARVAPDDTAELFRAADVARMSRRPAEAVAPLLKVLRNPSGPKAPLAAFTLGRLYLDDLRMPREAAKAFAEAHKLSPKGPLAEDALAREVEAWARAGDKARAHNAAAEYVGQYPSGLRLKAVKKFGSLE